MAVAAGLAAVVVAAAAAAVAAAAVLVKIDLFEADLRHAQRSSPNC
jgi:hypothetical protein